MQIKFSGVIEIETADVVEVLKPFIKPIPLQFEVDRKSVAPVEPRPKPETYIKHAVITETHEPDPAERLRETMEAEQKVEKPQTEITYQQALDACNATKKTKGLPAVKQAINDLGYEFFDTVPQDRYADLLEALKNG